MDITMQQIEIFIMCAVFRSISKASRALYLSQPVVSRQLRDMEERLGVRLFDRSSKGIMLSPDGDRLYAQLDPIYNRFRIASSQILENKAGDHLRIGCFHDPDIMGYMEGAVARFREACPAVGIETEYFNCSDLIEMLLCGQCDVIFTFSFETERHLDICSRDLGALPVYFIVPSEYGVSEIGDLPRLNEKELLLEVNSGREAALSVCSAHGFSPVRIRYVRSILLMSYQIIEGKGFTVGGGHLPGRGDRGVGVEFIPASSSECGELFCVCAAWRRNAESDAVKQFLRCCN